MIVAYACRFLFAPCYPYVRGSELHAYTSMHSHTHPSIHIHRNVAGLNESDIAMLKEWEFADVPVNQPYCEDQCSKVYELCHGLHSVLQLLFHDPTVVLFDGIFPVFPTCNL